MKEASRLGRAPKKASLAKRRETNIQALGGLSPSGSGVSNILKKLRLNFQKKTDDFPVLWWN